MTNLKGRQANRRLVLFGGMLFGIGTAIALSGAALIGTTLTAAIRRRLQEMETTPRELARQKWTQAKAATMAGNDAWRGQTKAGHDATVS